MDINLNDENKNDAITYFYWNVIDVEIVVALLGSRSWQRGCRWGVGGCLKGTDNNLVAKGTDIVAALVQHCPGIKVFYLNSQEDLKCDSLQLEMPKFKGTLKIHEVCWTKTKKEPHTNKKYLVYNMCTQAKNVNIFI